MRRFGKKDVLLIGLILVICGVCWLVIHQMQGTQGAEVVVTVDGTEYGCYPLNQNQTVEIQNKGVTTNILCIEDGYADMTDADCPDHLCVNQKSIHQTGESIICLPNKVVVTIRGTEKSNIDSMAR